MWLVALLSALVLALWFGACQCFGHAGFYFLYALTVTASVQLVGVYPVFARLSALAAPRLPFAYALGAAAYVAGLGLSLDADLSAAPVIVCLLAVLGAAVWWFVPSVWH